MYFYRKKTLVHYPRRHVESLLQVPYTFKRLLNRTHWFFVIFCALPFPHFVLSTHYNILFDTFRRLLRKKIIFWAVNQCADFLAMRNDAKMSQISTTYLELWVFIMWQKDVSVIMVIVFFKLFSTLSTNLPPVKS